MHPISSTLLRKWYTIDKKKKIVASKEATILFPADSLEKDLSKPVYI